MLKKLQFKNMSIAMKTSISSGVLILALLMVSGVLFFQMEQNMIQYILTENLLEIQTGLEERQQEEVSLLAGHIAFNGKILSNAIARPIFNLSDVNDSLISFMEIPEVVAIDVVSKEGTALIPYAAVWRGEGEKIQDDMEMPSNQDFSSFEVFETTPVHEGKEVGLIKIYYSAQILIEKIEQKKQEALANAEKKQKKVDEELLETLVLQGLGLLVIVMILTLCIIVLIRMLVIRALERITKMVENIAEGEGDLTQLLPERYRDEIGTLSHWFNVFITKLNQIISGLIEQSRELSTISSELDNNMKEVGDTVEEISRSISSSDQALEGTSSAINEMEASIKEMNQRVSESYNYFKKISDLAKEGNEAVQESIETMRLISESSQKANSAISIINDISSQTNLLSLNAAIEAAKAGEAGKGFSVVAEEIRRLAALSSDSADEIQQLTNVSADYVAKGASVIEVADASLANIVSGMTEMNTLLNPLTAAFDEMTKGIEEIVRNTDEVSGLSQSNVSAVTQIQQKMEQSVETVIQMSDSTHKIDNEINKFKVG